MLVQINMTNKLNLALLVEVRSLASNNPMPIIDAVEFMKASRMLMVLDPLGYL